MLYDPNWKPAEVEIKLEPWQKVLLKAADIIEETGWCRWHQVDKHGRHCILGAIHKARDSESPPIFLCISHFETVSKIGCAMIWNDAPDRTKEEVIAKLREVGHHAV